MDSERLRVRRCGEAAQRLMASPDFKVFLDEVREQAGLVAHKVLVAGSASFEDYQRERGYYSALEFVLGWPKDASDALIEMMESVDE